MSEIEIKALKSEFYNDYFRYLQDDARKEGYSVDFETEFSIWIDNR